MLLLPLPLPLRHIKIRHLLPLGPIRFREVVHRVGVVVCGETACTGVELRCLIEVGVGRGGGSGAALGRREEVCECGVDRWEVVVCW